MTTDINGKSKFLDPVDKAAFESLLSAIHKSYTDQGKKVRYTITISTFEKSTTEKQISLWLALVSLISKESGNDFRTVATTILNDFSQPLEIPEEMNNSRFQELLLFSTAFANSFFGINIALSDNEQFKIITK